jgi:hypothetical protein
MTPDVQEFVLITEFLAFLDPTIEAREGLTPEIRELLCRIALGDASDEERTRAIPLLNASSEAIAFLARQLATH